MFIMRSIILTTIAAGAVFVPHQVYSTTHYNLFKPSKIGVIDAYTALVSRIETVGAIQKEFSQVASDIKKNNSIESIISLYKTIHMAVKAGTFTADHTVEASFLTMVLEKFVTLYYKQLDILESASNYWDWAKKHGILYKLSTLPNKWLCNSADMVERNYVKVQQLRDTYNEQLGSMVRFLIERNENTDNLGAWFDRVQTFLQTVCANYTVDHVEIDAPNIVLAQKLLLHEQQLIASVYAVKTPRWLQRKWLMLTIGALGVGAAASWYMNNQQIAHNGFNSAVTLLNNAWQNYFCNPFNQLKDEIRKTFSTGDSSGKTSTLAPIDGEFSYQMFAKQNDNGTTTIAVTPTTQNLNNNDAANLASKVRHEGLGQFVSNSSSDKSWIPGMQSMYDTKEALDKIFCGLDLDVQRIKHIIAQIVNDYGQLQKDYTQIRQDYYQIKEQNKFVFIAGLFVPAGAITVATVLLITKPFRWLLKKDRHALYMRLCQINDLLIDSTHDYLSDCEYGRLLYLLMKEYEQVEKNVISEERDAFINDLQFLGQLTSSVQQKKEKLQNMWRKYRSLAMKEFAGI